MLATKDDLIAGLRRLDLALAPHHQAEVIVRFDDSFDWDSLDTCTRCVLPGHQHGRKQDFRYDTGSRDGLHARVFNDHVAFHLDLANACRDLASHLAKDTNLIPFTVLGGLLGLVVAGGRGAAIGGAVGAAIGGATPSRWMKRFSLSQALRHSRLTT